jgi:hypothetical protein
MIQMQTSYGMDSYAHNGIGSASEYSEGLQILPELGIEPCNECSMKESCAITGMACKAFRAYVNKGNYKEPDMGRLMKVFAE